MIVYIHFRFDRSAITNEELLESDVKLTVCMGNAYRNTDYSFDKKLIVALNEYNFGSGWSQAGAQAAFEPQYFGSKLAEVNPPYTGVAWEYMYDIPLDFSAADLTNHGTYLTMMLSDSYSYYGNTPPAVGYFQHAFKSAHGGSQRAWTLEIKNKTTHKIIKSVII